MAGGLEFGQSGLDIFLVARLGGADKIVVGQLEPLGEGQPVGGDGIAIFLWILFLGQGGLLDLLAMLVQAGQEENLLAEAAAGPRDDIRDDLFIGMSDVGLPVDVVNRRRDIKPFAHYRMVILAYRAVKGKRE